MNFEEQTRLNAEKIYALMVEESKANTALQFSTSRLGSKTQLRREYVAAAVAMLLAEKRIKVVGTNSNRPMFALNNST